MTWYKRKKGRGSRTEQISVKLGLKANLRVHVNFCARPLRARRSTPGISATSDAAVPVKIRLPISAAMDETTGSEFSSCCTQIGSGVPSRRWASEKPSKNNRSALNCLPWFSKPRQSKAGVEQTSSWTSQTEPKADQACFVPWRQSISSVTSADLARTSRPHTDSRSAPARKNTALWREENQSGHAAQCKSTAIPEL